jgi:hypothetical protein
MCTNPKLIAPFHNARLLAVEVAITFYFTKITFTMESVHKK